MAQQALWFGGDYNPEQWPEETWAEDLAAFEHLGVNTVTLPVFAWSALQPAKDRFELGWLDRVLDGLATRDIGVVLATPTAAQPAWMSAAYPEMLPVDAAGRRRRHGGRVNYCPTSTAYRAAAAEIAAVLAERYAAFAGLRLWHVNNEYGPTCYCDGCRDEFQRWLEERYGTLDDLNEAWGTAFWGNTLRDWSEVEFPSQLNAVLTTRRGSVEFSPIPGIALDHRRFASRALLQCYLTEKDELRRITPDVPVTTNFHGPVPTIDWQEWGPHLDVVSWNSYPTGESHWTHAAFGHDLARSAGGRGDFLMMEAAPGPVNWQPMNSLTRPGRVRLHALQAVARGSRGALYFQMRQSRSGNELHHAAFIPRHGRLDTRIGDELRRLSADLGAVGVPPETHRLEARTALVFEWDSWWAHHATPGLDQRSRYLETARRFHRILTERGLPVDIVDGERAAGGGYDVVVAPGLYLVTEQTAAALTGFVAAGGLLVTTVGSGIVDAAASVHGGGAEPAWRRLMGCWVEETDAQPPTVVNRVRFDDGGSAPARELFDVVRLDTAEAVAVFEDDFYAGSPAVTSNRVGGGSALYLASPSPELFAAVVDRYLEIPDPPPPAGVERVRWDGAGEPLLFLLNHGGDAATVTLPEGEWEDRLGGGRLGAEVVLGPAQVVVAGTPK